MKVQLPFDTSSIQLDIPGEYYAGSLVASETPLLPEGAVAESLRNPMGSAPLGELARGKRNACVVISDFTRPVPNPAILQPLLGVLHESGLDADQILILVAAGSHPPASDQVLREMVSGAIAERYRIVHHDARDARSLVPVDTFDGTRLGINKHYMAADLKIITGLIEPHVFAGYSGGRKAVCPGLTSLEAITRLHGPALLEHHNSRAGKFEGNPASDALASCVSKAGVDFMVNVTIDKDKRITGVFSGDYIEAHKAGIAFLDRHVRAYLDKPVDVVLTSGPGYPLDGTFLQSLKGAMAAENIVKEGGTVILYTGSRHGVGSYDMVRLFEEFGSWQNCIARIKSDAEPIPEQWIMHAFSRIRARTKIVAYAPGVDDDTMRTCWVEPASSPERAFADALDHYGPSARVAVLPQGSFVLADLRENDHGEPGCGQ